MGHPVDIFVSTSNILLNFRVHLSASDKNICQVEFIDRVCVPLYTVLSDSFPWIQPLLDGALANRSRWADLEEKVKMGLTWIDHDIIEVPVEEVEVSLTFKLGSYWG